jgi:mannan endo-1,4-beta-mannosidase
MSRPALFRRLEGVRQTYVGLLLAASVGSLVGCSSLGQPSGDPGGAGSTGNPAAERPEAEPVVPFDVRPLLKPSRKYLGAALENAPRSMTSVREFEEKVGKQPNLLAYYAAWGDQFEPQRVQNAWEAGALTMMAWEPFEPSIAEIADGATDDYVRAFADAVRTLNLPVAISFGHEMNGNWYPWGTKETDPADFVRAWRRIHGIFLDVGATNVIWVWSPNVINPVPKVPLRPFYPGDKYVDWIGIVGYYTDSGASTFSPLFGPTRTAVRKFTRKPILIAETASEPGPRKRQDIADLFAGVAASPDFVGFVWFNHHKRADWRVDTDASALAEFKRRAASRRFGFDVTQL